MTMTTTSIFTHTEPELITTLDELRRREPIFHTPGFGVSAAEYELAMAPAYWEVGASGRRYSRDLILREMDGKEPVLAASLGWLTWDHALRRLGPDTFLLTYTLKSEIASHVVPQFGSAAMVAGKFCTTRERSVWRKAPRRSTNRLPFNLRSDIRVRNFFGVGQPVGPCARNDRALPDALDYGLLCTGAFPSYRKGSLPFSSKEGKGGSIAAPLYTGIVADLLGGIRLVLSGVAVQLRLRRHLLTVLWALEWAMVCLAGLVYLPPCSFLP